MSCEYFLGWAYLHWLVAGLVSATSAATNPLERIGFTLRDWSTIGFMVLALFVLTYWILRLPLGPLKYSLFLLLSVFTGSLLLALFDLFEKKEVVVNILITNCSIFIFMSLIGFFDSENSRPFWQYLVAALAGQSIGRVVAEEIRGSLPQTELLLSLVSTTAFAIYVAYDTSMLKRMARGCAEGRRVADPIQGAMGLYEDLLSLATTGKLA